MLPVARYAVKHVFVEAEVIRDRRGRFAHQAGDGMDGARRFTSQQDAADWAHQHLVPESLGPRDRAALHTYTTDMYEWINNKFREPSTWDDELSDQEQEKVADHAQLVSDALAKGALPDPVYTFRGGGGTSLGVDLEDPAAMQSLVGQVLDWPAPTSTSIGTSAAAAFARADVQYMFRIPAGYPAVYLEGISGGLREHEVLMAPGAVGVVHGVYQRRKANGAPQWFMEVEIVPSDWQPGNDWQPAPLGDAHVGFPGVA